MSSATPHKKLLTIIQTKLLETTYSIEDLYDLLDSDYANVLGLLGSLAK